MATKNRAAKSKRTGAARHRRKGRDTDRVVRWLQAGAVATGVSAAVISGQGVAWATTDTDADTTAANAADTEKTTAGNQDSPTTPGPDPSAGSPTDLKDDPNATSSSTNQTVAAGKSPDVTISAQTTVSSDKDEEEKKEPVPEEVLEEESGTEHDGDETEAEQTNTGNRRAHSDTTSHQPLARRTALAQTSLTTVDSSKTQADDTTFSAMTTFAAANVDASAVVLRPPTATVTVTEVTPPQTTQSRPLRQIVVGVLSLFGFTPNPAPGAPTPNPLLEAIWGLYRRVESVFDNQRPTVQSATVTNSQLTDEGDVIVSGAVDFDDEDGDPLSYSSTNGAHGAVTVNPDGTFTYTPTDPAYTGTDTFTVTARDTGFHVHGLFGLFSPGGGHTRTATVQINLAAADNDAPVINSVDSTPGTGNTWTVTVDADDPDDDPITYGLTAADPTRVTITPVTGHTNQFTVTVTDTAWAKANPGKQLFVTATATDGAANATPVAKPIGTVSNAIALGVNTNGQTDLPALPAGVHYTQVSAGSDGHIVLLRSDGTAVGTGDNQYGQSDIPAPPAGVIYTQVAAGHFYTLLLRDDGQIDTVGGAQFAPDIPTPPAGVHYTSMSVTAAKVALLLSDGSAYAGNQMRVPPPGVEYTQVSQSFNHTLLLRSDGKVDAIGSTGDDYLEIPPLPAGMKYTQVAAGGGYSLMLRSDGNVVKAGIGLVPSIPAPTDEVRYTGIIAAQQHFVLLRSDGTAVALGNDVSGDTTIPAIPTTVAYTGGAAAGGFVGGAANGTTVLLTRFDNAPQATDNTVDAIEDTPLLIQGIPLVEDDVDPDGQMVGFDVVWGAQHGTTSVDSHGNITYTPNANYFGTDTFHYLASDGTLGDAATVTVNIAGVEDAPVINSVISTPGTGNSWTVDVTATDPDGDNVEVSVTTANPTHITVTPVAGQSGKFTVTVTDAAWALANPGQQISINVNASDGIHSVGLIKPIGTVNNVIGAGAAIPALPAGLTYTKFSAFHKHIVLLRSDGTVVASGSPDFGKLDIPPLDAGVTYTDVAAGEFHTVLLRSDGTAVTFGRNSYGELQLPTLAPGVTIKQVEAGYGSSVYLLSDGTVVAYGNWTNELAGVPPLPAGVKYTKLFNNGFSTFMLRSDGQVDAFGNNFFGNLAVPPLPAGVTYTDVGAGPIHTVFLRSDGTVDSSGHNGFGQRNIPALPAGVTYTHVVAGRYHTVLLRSDGTVVAVGTDLEGTGELNIPTLPAGVVYTNIGAGENSTLLMLGVAIPDDEV